MLSSNLSVTDLPSKLQLDSNQRSVRCENMCYCFVVVQFPFKKLKHRPNITKAGDVLLFSRNSCDAIGPFLSPTIPRTRPLLVVSPIWSVTDLSQKLQLGGNPKAWQWHSVVPMLNKPRFRGRLGGVKTKFETQLGLDFSNRMAEMGLGAHRGPFGCFSS